MHSLHSMYPLWSLVLCGAVAGTGPAAAAAAAAVDVEIPAATRQAAARAEALLDSGSTEDLARASILLEAVLAAQETREGAARLGNFYWNRADGVVTDLNSASFTLRHLIPLSLRHGNRLDPDLHARLREAIRLGCEELARLDVAITYTNIAAMDCLNSILGGELLEEPAFFERGRRRLETFCDVTLGNGTIYEFNSVNYVHVVLDAMKRLADHTGHEASRVRARTLASRLAMSLALHIEPESGRLTGPYSRVPPAVQFAQGAPYIETVREWIAEGAAPAWVERFLGPRPLPMTFKETSLAGWDMGVSAYATPEYVLGVATREISRQSGVFSLHHGVDGGETGVLVARYLINDRYFGGSLDGQDPAPRPSLVEHGKAFAVHDGNRALCVYAPRFTAHPASFAPSSRDNFSSLKLALLWWPRSAVDEIWVGGSRIERLPADVPPEAAVVVGFGGVYTAVLPLAVEDLDHGAPIRLVEAGEYLALELHNYLGPEKVMWNIERMSRFFQGEPRNGFYAEVSPRGEWAGGRAFGEAVARGTLQDEPAPPFTAYMDPDASRPWTVAYSRDGAELGLEVDLMQWRMRRRWTNEGELGWPMLESPVARHNDTGRVSVNGAVLECGAAPAWLFAAPDGEFWLAGYHGPPAPFSLTLPDGGRVDLDAMGTGTLIWDRGEVRIEAIGVSGEPRVSGGRLAGD